MQVPGKRFFGYGLQREPHYILAFFFVDFFFGRDRKHEFAMQSPRVVSIP